LRRPAAQVSHRKEAEAEAEEEAEEEEEEEAEGGGAELVEVAFAVFF
jgi:ribosomal protein L12E/L44/L45/RPP1/RPP2